MSVLCQLLNKRVGHVSMDMLARQEQATQNAYVRPKSNFTDLLILFWAIIIQCVQELRIVWHSTDTPAVKYLIRVVHAFQDISEKRALAMDHALVL